MAQYSIRGKRILKISLPKEFDVNTIQIGVPVMDDGAKRVGLKRRRHCLTIRKV